MPENNPNAPRITIVSFSLSNQTKKLIRAFKEGLASSPEAVQVEHLRLAPTERIPFPFPSIPATMLMMVKTLFRVRIPISELPPAPLRDSGLLVLAGPTWSYNPCGPVLSFLDTYGDLAMSGRPVLPIISCRGYWRLHWHYLKGEILRHGGTPLGPWVFTHPSKEPWRTVGVFLTVAGKHPRRFPLLRRHYPRYGHDRKQLQRAAEMGAALPASMADPEALKGPIVV